MEATNENGDMLTSGERSLVEGVLALPHKIIQNHNMDGLAQLVLYDLSRSGCFGLKKAAYFVDNPDFDCLRGIAGFSAGELETEEDIWLSPEKYSNEMANLSFNSDVRSFRGNSFLKKGIDFSDVSQISTLAGDFGINSPSSMGWRLKHGNHGLFVYEPREDVCVWRKSVLASVVAFLGLCAI